MAVLSETRTACLSVALTLTATLGTTLRSASRHDGLEICPVELVPGVIRYYRHFHADGPELLMCAPAFISSCTMVATSWPSNRAYTM